MREIQSILAQVGARLRDERKRIDRSQAELGTVGGVNRDSQAAYEAGKRPPDAAYLLSIREVGVDLNYLLTGARSSADLSPEAGELVKWFDLLDDEGRAAIMHIVRMMARGPSGSQRLHSPAPGFRGEKD
jgi:transcriptional regulator with XRE-family HTH domain